MAAVHRVQALPPSCLQHAVELTKEEKPVVVEHVAEEVKVNAASAAPEPAAPAAPEPVDVAEPAEPEFTPREGRKRIPTQRLRSSELRDSMRNIFHRPMRTYREDQGSPDSTMAEDTVDFTGNKRPAPTLLDLHLSHKRFQPIPVIRPTLAPQTVTEQEDGCAAKSKEEDAAGTHSDGAGSSTSGPPKLKRGEREPPKKRGRPPKSASMRGGLAAQGVSRAGPSSRGVGRSRDPPLRFSPSTRINGTGRPVGRPPRQAAVVGEQKRELSMLKDEEKSRLMQDRRVVAVAKRGRKSLAQKAEEAARANGHHGRSSTGDGEDGEVYHRRDWGLMEVDSVGRNKPPFARTLLCHGTMPANLRGLEEAAVARHWVIKRWPEKTTRRRIDVEVHERIKAHPHDNLVRIIDLSTSDGVLMEYWKGGDLQRYMATARRKFMPVRAILRLGCQLVRAIRHLHQLKIVHSDVSPQNVFLRHIKGEVDEDGEEAERKMVCALGDFGHSYIVSQHQESRSSIASHGTSFVAPEVEGGSVSSMASDVYSAGKLLLELLNLSSGFKDLFSKEPRAMVRHLQSLFVKMCSEAPALRPSSAEACKLLEKHLQTLYD